MNDDQLDDLKQFIDTRLSQVEITLRDEMDEMKNDIQQLSQKMDDGFAGIADIFEQVNGRLDDHEDRVGKLEQQAA